MTCACICVAPSMPVRWRRVHSELEMPRDENAACAGFGWVSEGCSAGVGAVDTAAAVPKRVAATPDHKGRERRRCSSELRRATIAAEAQDVLGSW